LGAWGEGDIPACLPYAAGLKYVLINRFNTNHSPIVDSYAPSLLWTGALLHIVPPAATARAMALLFAVDFWLNTAAASSMNNLTATHVYLQDISGHCCPETYAARMSLKRAPTVHYPDTGKCSSGSITHHIAGRYRVSPALTSTRRGAGRSGSKNRGCWALADWASRVMGHHITLLAGCSSTGCSCPASYSNRTAPRHSTPQRRPHDAIGKAVRSAQVLGQRV
jgi:hypothetical protein